MGKSYINLRLTPETADRLTEAGAKAGRRLSAECAFRLENEMAPQRPPRFPGWPEAEAEDFQRFGDLVADLYMEVTRRLGTSADRKRRLGFMRSAVNTLLDMMEADRISEVEAGWNAHATRDLLLDQRLKDYAANPNLGVTEYTESDLARRFRELKGDQK